MMLLFILLRQPVANIISPLTGRLSPLQQDKKGYEVFGFAPHWTFDKLDNVNFDVLTTFAYFGIPVDSEGNLDTTDRGYEVFQSSHATDIFRKAHAHGTRVVLTITQMDNNTIETLMNNPEAQNRVINQTVSIVKERGIDGVNIDFEYLGNPGEAIRNQFSSFVARMTQDMHASVPFSKVTVSVYASAIKDPKIYDIPSIGRSADGIFMMAYDFATTSADNAMPTAPLYGYKSGKYWYDVASAVDDFLRYIPADKLILGVPWYGYNYLVYEPGIKAETRPYWTWRGKPTAQTYSIVQSDVSASRTGWDKDGQVGWKAYYVEETGTWRMVFVDDVRSLGMKYDFAKERRLKGVGMWALGFDEGRSEMWNLLANKFGSKFANGELLTKNIN